MSKYERDLAMRNKCVEHWEDVKSTPGMEVGSAIDCAFCDAYNEPLPKIDKCTGCPIYLHTGRQFCSGTPYTDLFLFGYMDGPSPDRNDPEFIRLMDKEIKFLKELPITRDMSS